MLGESMENLKINFKEFILDNGFKILVLNKQCKFFNFNNLIKSSVVTLSNNFLSPAMSYLI